MDKDSKNWSYWSNLYGRWSEHNNVHHGKRPRRIRGLFVFYFFLWLSFPMKKFAHQFYSPQFSSWFPHFQHPLLTSTPNDQFYDFIFKCKICFPELVFTTLGVNKLHFFMASALLLVGSKHISLFWSNEYQPLFSIRIVWYILIKQNKLLKQIINYL